MENNLYSASPGGEKNRWYKIQSTVRRTVLVLGPCGAHGGGTKAGNTRVRSVVHSHLSTGTHRRPMAATYLFTSCQ